MIGLFGDARIAAEQAADDAYRARLHKHLADSLSGVKPGSLSLLEICRRGDGAFPTVVREVVSGWFHYTKFELRRASTTAWRPELSPIRTEWYYNRTSVGKLVSRLSGAVLAVGAPTAAVRAAAAGMAVILVDDSPWIPQRFDLSHLNLCGSRFLAADLGREFDTVLLDPPWYQPEMPCWLEKAAALTLPGGRILMSVPGRFTRPTAEREQNSMLQLAEKYGETRIERGVLEYETPLFEREALKAAGLPITGSWRTGDLIVVRRGSNDVPKVSAAVPPAGGTPEWSEFRILDQIVAVRTSRQVERGPRPRDTEGLLQRVPDVDGLVLDSVSRRDPRLADVDVWTSRNRVAMSPRPGDIAALLDGFNLAVELGTRPDERAMEVLKWLEVAA